jgi:hypothetical protein
VIRLVRPSDIKRRFANAVAKLATAGVRPDRVVVGPNGTIDRLELIVKTRPTPPRNEKSHGSSTYTPVRALQGVTHLENGLQQTVVVKVLS